MPRGENETVVHLARWNPVADGLGMVSGELRGIVTGVVLIGVAITKIMQLLIGNFKMYSKTIQGHS